MAIRSIFAVSTLFLLPFFAFSVDRPACHQPDQLSFVSQLLNVPLQAVPQVIQGLTANSGPASPEDILYLYYPPGSSDPVPITPNTAGSVIDSSKPITFIVHGWKENGTLPWIKTMANLLNKYSSPMNVIVVDWWKVSNKNYIVAASSTHALGGFVADFITAVKLVSKKIHLIGHSLGSHIVGSAGNKLGGTVDRITALDPASPLYEFHSLNRALTRNDAKWVDAIHTGWPFGYKTSCCKNDFYVNSGVKQPGCIKFCASDVMETVFCSHKKSHTYYSLSIINGTRFQAHKKLSNQMAYMGHHVTKIGGNYHVRTTAASGIDPTTM